MTRPRQPAGARLIGWRAQRNRQDLREEGYESKEQAIEDVERASPYPLEWTVGAVDPAGHAHLLGRHPEKAKLESLGWRAALTPEGKQRSDDLLSRIGPDAAWDCWYVEPVYQSLTRPVPNASFPHQGARYYVAPTRYRDDRWDIYEYFGPEINARRIETCDTREEALVRAGELDYQDQRRTVELKKSKPANRVLSVIAWFWFGLEGLFGRKER